MYDASVTNSEALCMLQVSQIRRLYIRCKCHKFGGSIYVASVATIRRLYVRCKCHKFGGTIYVASVANSEGLYVYIRICCVTNSEALCMIQVSNWEALYTLQVSPLRRLCTSYTLCHQYGNFMYVASGSNSEALHTLQVSLTTGFNN
jgi:hypothetical protein